MVEALDGLLPDDVVNRPKMGFVLPWESWLRGELKEVCDAGLQSLKDRAWVHSDAIAGMERSFHAGKPHGLGAGCGLLPSLGATLTAMASSDTIPEGNRPLRILAVVEWYPPAYKAGGPIRSVHNLMQMLQAQTDHHLEVVCGDRDLGSALPLEGIEIDVPHIREGIQVTYRSSVTSTHGGSKSCVAQPDNPAPDVVYLNSLFSVPFALHPLRAARTLGIRVVLAPRGMLGAGALAIKPVKKKVFMTAARLLGLFRGVRWHASTEVERAEILTHLPGSDVHTALNVPLTDANVTPLSKGVGLTWAMVGNSAKKEPPLRARSPAGRRLERQAPAGGAGGARRRRGVPATPLVLVQARTGHRPCGRRSAP